MTNPPKLNVQERDVQSPEPQKTNKIVVPAFAEPGVR